MRAMADTTLEPLADGGFQVSLHFPCQSASRSQAADSTAIGL
jgi:hypothetical protein